MKNKRLKKFVVEWLNPLTTDPINRYYCYAATEEQARHKFYDSYRHITVTIISVYRDEDHIEGDITL
jgi:hypothetical protein